MADEGISALMFKVIEKMVDKKEVETKAKLDAAIAAENAPGGAPLEGTKLIALQKQMSEWTNLLNASTSLIKADKDTKMGIGRNF